MTAKHKHTGRWRPRRLIGLLTALAGLTMFLVGLVGTTTAGATPRNNGGGHGGDNNLKVFVCKYVGKPGVDERLQTGQNPIDVSVNSIKDYNGVGSYFNDAQGRSYVLAEDHGQPTPDVSECPAPQGPPPSSTPPPPPPPTASGSATRSCPSGTVTGTVSATGIPGANDSGHWQGLLFLVYQNTPLDQEVSNANGDVTFHFSTDAVPKSASSFTVEIQSPTQSGGVDIPVNVSVEGTCETTPPPPPPTQVTPAAVTFTDSSCDVPNNASFTIPETTQDNPVVYEEGSSELSSGKHDATDGSSVDITAHPSKDGVELTGQTEWKHDFPTPSDCQTSTPPTSSTPPPPPTQVTPAQPRHTTPDCTSPDETVTPSDQEGVVWTPAGNTTLKPGESVTYTASPADGYVFPEGAQTSWTFSDNLDVSKCSTSTPPPPPGHPTASGSATRSCPSGTVTATVSATGIPGPNGSGHYQGLLFLVYQNSAVAQAISNANGDVTFKDVVLTSVPKTATSFKVEIQSPTQSGGVDITVKVKVTGTCSTSTPPPPPTHTKTVTPPPPPTHTKTKTVTPPPPPTHTTTVTTTAAPPAPPSSSVYTPGSGGTGDTPLANTGSPYKLLLELGLALMVGGGVLTATRRRQGARQH